MVRVFLVVALLTGLLFADSIHQNVQKMIGQRTYSQNRLILNTVFSQPGKFYKNGRIDYVKVAQVLTRLGLIRERYEKPVRQDVIYQSFDNTPLFLRLMMDSLQKGGVFDYVIKDVQRDDEGAVVGFSFRSAGAFDLTEALRYLENHGAKVLDVEKIGDGWRIFCDVSQAVLVRSAEHAHERVDEPLWINVAKKSRLIVDSHPKNHWHPLIVLYDRRLHPLRLIEMSHKRDSLEISLPKECYYIKISDKFTIRNIKYGLRIRAF